MFHVTTPRVNAESSNNSPKLERPKSLEIQMDNSVQEPRIEEPIEEGPEDEVDVVPAQDIEPEIQKLEITGDMSPSPGSGKKTPRHLTEQGYFDLKFYHNKLW
ncbi:hypothetical protein WA026_014660 [Henosepilachna vigintioctopunctata]|uniref:Uncharacterized protein n=1 Tax=Henosepilachna vigintioctopunctata TaxID=420089 RepID=A0AAW1VFJ4_9CUCU